MSAACRCPPGWRTRPSSRRCAGRLLVGNGYWVEASIRQLALRCRQATDCYRSPTSGKPRSSTGPAHWRCRPRTSPACARATTKLADCSTDTPARRAGCRWSTCCGRCWRPAARIAASSAARRCSSWRPIWPSKQPRPLWYRQRGPGRDCRRVELTLNGRHDSAQHFVISAALAAWAGEPVAEAIGLYKELDDARRGSGFSFADLAADRAGTRFGELVAKASARLDEALQRILGRRPTLDAGSERAAGVSRRERIPAPLSAGRTAPPSQVTARRHRPPTGRPCRCIRLSRVRLLAVRRDRCDTTVRPLHDSRACEPGEVGTCPEAIIGENPWFRPTSGPANPIQGSTHVQRRKPHHRRAPRQAGRMAQERQRLPQRLPPREHRRQARRALRRQGTRGARGHADRGQGRRPHHAQARHGQGQLRHHPGSLRPHPALRHPRQHRRGRLCRLQALGPGRHRRRRRHADEDQDRRADRPLLGNPPAHQGAAAAAGEVPRPHRRRAEVSPALPRPDHQRGIALHLRRPQPHDRLDPQLHDRARLPRSRDADDASDPRRRLGQALHHAPQRARHAAVPAHRAGAVPQAPGGRRLREGVRDQPQLPQRRPLARATTPNSP